VVDYTSIFFWDASLDRGAIRRVAENTNKRAGFGSLVGSVMLWNGHTSALERNYSRWDSSDAAEPLAGLLNRVWPITGQDRARTQCRLAKVDQAAGRLIR
jgi:hypothetical protein